MTNFQETIVTTTKGPIAFQEAGTGPAVILLHGNGHSHHEFSRVIPLLADNHRVISWDMPGHGASRMATATLSIEESADALREGLAHLGIHDAAIVGTSIGAFIAAAFAAKNPSEARALVLAEMQLRTRAWWDKAWPVVETMFGECVQTHDYVQARLESPLDEALLARWNGDRQLAGADTMIAAMAALRDHPIATTLSRITVPTLFLFGESGPTVDCAETLGLSLPGARQQVIPQAGHFISIDQPQAFAQAIEHISTEQREGG
ncbi:alpha/beta fold hydrolase [Parasphingorhabdus sp.]|uniref:alpha/beta fold hydrolase n=1 Tax=Parasphingorhabdus sp. TaxID=2709688 RepID=UPI003A9279B0